MQLNGAAGSHKHFTESLLYYHGMLWIAQNLQDRVPFQRDEEYLGNRAQDTVNANVFSVFVMLAWQCCERGLDAL